MKHCMPSFCYQTQVHTLKIKIGIDFVKKEKEFFFRVSFEDMEGSICLKSPSHRVQVGKGLLY